MAPVTYTANHELGLEDTSSDEDSEGGLTASDCSPFSRQTAKLRFTRTTSTVQHLMEARREDGGRTSHLFGCLRRTSSSRTMQYEEERNLTPSPKVKVDTPRTSSQEADKRRRELDRTRREVKKLDQQLEEQQQKGFSQQYLSCSAPDAWISQLPDESTISAEDCWGCCKKNQENCWPPHVDLEPFTGEAKDWPEFIRRFKTWIHDAMPDDAVRMIYLEELLSSDVKELYAPFFRRPDYYRHLLAHLRDRYGAPHLVASSCLTALKQLTLLDPANPAALVAFSRQVQHIGDTLRTIGCERELLAFSTLELSGLIQKLPDSLRASWDLYVQGRSSQLPLPNLKDFSTWINTRANSSWYRWSLSLG